MDFIFPSDIICFYSNLKKFFFQAQIEIFFAELSVRIIQNGKYRRLDFDQRSDMILQLAS